MLVWFGLIWFDLVWFGSGLYGLARSPPKPARTLEKTTLSVAFATGKSKAHLALAIILEHLRRAIS